MKQSPLQITSAEFSNQTIAMTRNCYHRHGILLVAAACISATPLLQAETPLPEDILPGDTVAMFTIPDWSKMMEIQRHCPQWELWNDAQMKPFREHFAKKWNEEVVEPLEQELGLQFKDYQGILQGQLTLGLIQNDWEAGNDHSPGFVIVLDSRDHKDQLSNNLEALRRKWVDKGKTLRTETIRGVDFSVVELSTNDLPNTLRKFMPGSSDVQEYTGEPDEAPKPARHQLFVGQSDSVLILADALPTAQKVMNRLTGGSLPSLGEVDQFNMDRNRLFRTAHAYGWVNATVLTRILERNLTAMAEKREENAPDPLAQIQPTKVISATGLSGLKSAALAYTETPRGSEIVLFLGVPESARRGIFSILAGEPRDTLPPSFVPADVVEYQRWRLDGQKTYAALEQMLQEISPQMLSGWNFALNTADTAAKEKDPSFDLRQQLVGNLGDDMITYKKPPRGTSAEDLGSQPTLFLLGAKNGEQIIGALKMVLGMFLRGTPPSTREFLGTTIYTFELPNPARQFDPDAAPRTVSLAASRGYVAMTADPAILEEFLRSADSPVKSLRQVPGLAESTEVVMDPGTSLLSFEDQKAAMRVQFELLRQQATNATEQLQDPRTPIPDTLGVGLPRKGLKEWFDFSLLPPFEQIEKYFSHTVYGGGGGVDGLTMKIFSPTPPALRHQSSEAE